MSPTKADHMNLLFSAPVPPRKGLLFSMKNTMFVFLTAAVMLAVFACRTDCADTTPPGFVHLAEAVPNAILEVRYYSTYNFVGDRIRGYERPTSLLSVEAANALKAVATNSFRWATA